MAAMLHTLSAAAVYPDEAAPATPFCVVGRAGGYLPCARPRMRGGKDHVTHGARGLPATITTPVPRRPFWMAIKGFILIY